VNRTSGLIIRRVLVLVTAIVVACSLTTLSPPMSQASHTNEYLCGHWVVGLIKHRYDQVPGTLGCPTSDELTNPGNTGKRQHFGTRGNIYWKNTNGFAYSIWGQIWAEYSNKGYEAGAYRYPSSNELCCLTGGYYYQYFRDHCWVLAWSPTEGPGHRFRCD
jgi:uncharacterized protein with LGFP repeats